MFAFEHAKRNLYKKDRYYYTTLFASERVRRVRISFVRTEGKIDSVYNVTNSWCEFSEPFSRHTLYLHYSYPPPLPPLIIFFITRRYCMCALECQKDECISLPQVYNVILAINFSIWLWFPNSFEFFESLCLHIFSEFMALTTDQLYSCFVALTLSNKWL